MRDFLEAIAQANNWNFTYGRKDFQNLDNSEAEQEKIYVFLDPVEVEEKHDESGSVEEIIYSGHFMLVYSSHIDEVDYNYRYETYIKPVLEAELKKVKDSLICTNEATLKIWKTLEVINMLDNNYDGISVAYTISVNEQ